MARTSVSARRCARICSTGRQARAGAVGPSTQREGHPDPAGGRQHLVVRRSRQLRHARLQVPGYVFTDEEGRYEFTTIIPGCYYPRDAKHIHVKLQGVSSPVTTQLYIEGEPGNEEDAFYTTELLVRCTVDANGTKHGTFDFVIRQVTEKENVTPESAGGASRRPRPCRSGP